MNNKKNKSQYRVVNLATEDVTFPWLCESVRDYKTKIALLQKDMGGTYQVFSELVEQLINHLDESKQIQRIMPKNERVVANWIKIAVGPKVHNYLLLVGAEVSTKTKSMGYGLGKDLYACQNCYYVLGSQEPLNEEKFGNPKGERQVRNYRFHEYSTPRSSLHELVLQLMKIIMAKENIKPKNSKE